MRETPGIIGVRISTRSVGPLSGVMQIDTATATLQLEFNEEVAHELCTQLDRFLTQARTAPNDVRRPPVARRAG